MNPAPCCVPCATVPPVQVPGVEGSPGDNGTNGLNAFTFTTLNFVVPAIGSSVTIAVVSSTFATIGQNVNVQGAGTFAVTGKPTSTSLALTYLNYTGNTAAGNTINSGAQVSPDGYQPSGQTLLPQIEDYHVGGSQALTTTPAQLLGSSIVLADPGTYLLFSGYRIDFVGTTFAAAKDITIKLRETNNGPADIANAVEVLNTGTPTTESQTFMAGNLPTKVYTAAANDTIQVFGDVSGAPGAGSVEAIEAWVMAIKLF